MRKVTKTEMISYWEAGILEDILVLPDRVLARKTCHYLSESEGAEIVYCDLP